MGYMKLSLCLLIIIMMTLTAKARRHGERLQFQDSLETGEYSDGERTGIEHRNRNHRGRAGGHQKHGGDAGGTGQFEQGIPDLYPLKGSAQAPLALNTHPGRGLGLQKHKFAVPVQQPNNFQGPPLTIPQFIGQPVQQPPIKQYEGNPFLSGIQSPAADPANKPKPVVFPTAYNELATTDKLTTTSTTTPNPRRTDLLYGSNLLEEERIRESKSGDNTEISFDDRILIDSAPHCKEGQILVNSRCRTSV